VDLLIHFAASWKERPIFGLAFERDAPGRSFIQGLLLFERRPRARFRCEDRSIGNRILVFLKMLFQKQIASRQGRTCKKCRLRFRPLQTVCKTCHLHRVSNPRIWNQ
jgi:hypothetical protein